MTSDQRNNVNYRDKLFQIRTDLHRQFIETGKLTGREIDQVNEAIEASYN